jgi:hypothetical protein
MSKGKRVDNDVLRVHGATALRAAFDAGKVVNGSGGHDKRKALLMTCAADVTPEPVRWLWPGRIAEGKQVIIGGEPGQGKSNLGTYIAAAISTAGLWPCGEGRAPLGDVLIFSAEDGKEDTIVPRLMAAGADLKRVHIVTAIKQEDDKGHRSFNLKEDLDALERALKERPGIRLVIMDPVSSYMGKADTHVNAEVRGVLEPIGELAARMRVAFLSITNASQQDGRPKGSQPVHGQHRLRCRCSDGLHRGEGRRRGDATGPFDQLAKLNNQALLHSIMTDAVKQAKAQFGSFRGDGIKSMNDLITYEFFGRPNSEIERANDINMTAKNVKPNRALEKEISQLQNQYSTIQPQMLTCFPFIAETFNKAVDEVEQAKREAEQGRKQREEEASKRLAQEQHRKAEAARIRQEQAEKEHQARVSSAAAAGYKLVTINDLLLDGKQLIATGVKVAFDGHYMNDGNFDMIFGSSTDMLMSQGSYGHVRDTTRRVLVITDNAPRDTREYILQCKQRGWQGCAVSFTGHMTMCSIQNGFGAKREEPCIAVE